MNTFLKVIGVLALCCIGGCVVLGILGGLAAKRVADDPQFQKAVQDANTQVQKMNDPPIVTLAEFNQLQNGITYEQAKQLIGADGTVQSENNIGGIHTVMYTWTNPSFADGNMNAMFQNNALMSKSQIGLK